MATPGTLVHATAVCLAGAGVLLRGPSGAGKSDLALRLIDRGARLISDDQTALERRGAAVMASAPPALHGLIEVRGVGLVRLAHVTCGPIAAIIDLVPEGAYDRVPDPAWEPLLGVSFRRWALNAFEESAPLKVALLVERSLLGYLTYPVDCGPIERTSAPRPTG